MTSTDISTTTPTALQPIFAAAHVALPPVQAAPAYVCFVCGAPARGLRYWPTGGGHSPLDAYAAHIAYLRPGCDCHLAQPGCTRVAVLDGAITPLALVGAEEIPSFAERWAANVANVRAAIDYLQNAR